MYGDNEPLIVGFAHYLVKPKKPISPYPITKPDWDNLDKLVADAMEGTVYKIDSRIVGTLAWPEHGKHYAERNPPWVGKGPRTEIVVMTVEEFLNGSQG